MFECAYPEEATAFKRTVKELPLDDLPRDFSVTNYHVLYKLKVNDDMSHKLKAMISFHSNEYLLKYEMRTDCGMRPSVGLRVPISVSALKMWRISKFDVVFAFLQTFLASRRLCYSAKREFISRRKVFVSDEAL